MRELYTRIENENENENENERIIHDFSIFELCVCA